jgi:hypothetical protein
MKNLIIAFLVAFVAMAPFNETNAQFKSSVKKYSIPSYNVMVTQNTIFQQPHLVIKKAPSGDRDRIKANVEVQPPIPMNAPNAIIATVQFYSLDGSTSVGPFDVYENEVLEVDLDDKNGE